MPHSATPGTSPAPLKVIIILIATDSGYQVMTSDDYDGDVEKIVREYDFYSV